MAIQIYGIVAFRAMGSERVLAAAPPPGKARAAGVVVTVYARCLRSLTSGGVDWQTGSLRDDILRGRFIGSYMYLYNCTTVQ